MPSMPKGWQIALFPIPLIHREIRDASGNLLRAFAPNVKLPKIVKRGAWPEGSRREAWFRSPSGRKHIISEWSWRMGAWVQKMDHEVATDRITIRLDYGGAFIWDELGRCCVMGSFFDEPSGALGLEPAFINWQSRFDRFEPWTGEVEPEGGWAALEEDGLELCLKLAEWIGPEGYIQYFHPPKRMDCNGRVLVLAWEPT